MRLGLPLHPARNSVNLSHNSYNLSSLHLGGLFNMSVDKVISSWICRLSLTPDIGSLLAITMESLDILLEIVLVPKSVSSVGSLGTI
jgi:hypothetical protein